MAIRRILHPTDFSPASRPAFRRAVELARALRGSLLVVHVMPPPPLVGEGYITPATIAAILRSQRDAAERGLRTLVRRAHAASIRVSGRLAASGLTHEQIVRAARRQRADVIVMGTHGRTGLRRLMLGSVAARVISTAPCPVLTVRS